MRLLALIPAAATLLAAGVLGSQPLDRHATTINSGVTTTGEPVPLAYGGGWLNPASGRLARASRKRAHAYLIATVRPGSSVAVYAHPFGRAIDRLGDRTTFGSPRAFSVVRRRGRWLEIADPTLNRQLGWITAQPGRLRYTHTQLEIDINLSTRTLVLRRSTHILRRTPVDIGAPTSPTPTGRFAITDKLPGAAYDPAYGCCILALSTRQTHLPSWWNGGNRIAIHGNPTSKRFGHTLTAGCVHAPVATLRYLIRILPLGTPVIIHQ
jgi:hypothetical protein